jgi:photosystem II stability/assembly factor-like uncharacterized protein
MHLIVLFALAALATPLAAQRARPVGNTTDVDTMRYAGMRYRMVGPFRGGRATAVTGVASRPHLFYMGTTGGGVWKSDDAGHHWQNITDGFLDVGNIGAIDVADSDPSIIYVGTGSASIRGNSSVGRGAWKSADAGRSWRFIGLRETGAIGELIVHPSNPDIVYVAALGHPFGKNRERGVFRTRDGGASWQQVLTLDDSTGAVALAIDPSNPRTLYAGAWSAERKPWTMRSGGPAGGVYRSTDGGDSWTRVSSGLPTSIVGKVGLTTSAAMPNRVYALIEAERGGLYRSDDHGVTWARVSEDSRVRARPFYYTHVVADPTDGNTVWVLNTPLLKSIDGGRTFEQVPVPHGDTHDLWINPTNPEIFALSDDGGTVVTLNGGRTFSSMYNQPTAELYDVMVDNQTPYRLYGSQQDNSSISVLQHRLGNTLRPQQEWGYAAGCETGPIAVHPDHPGTIWGGCYGGAINRYDVASDHRISVARGLESQGIAPSAMRDRWQWVAPIVVSPQEPRTIYHASQYLYRSKDGGDTWTRISPDLTTNDSTVQRKAGGPITPDNTGVEVFTTIFAVVPSPHDASTIWVGTDDGRVQLTRDDGATWRDITPPSLPRYATVNRIEVSAHAPGRAFIAVQRYRLDDFTPYIFRTTDYGATWTRLTDGRNGIPPDHPVRVVREDTERKGLLYAGTEFGLFASFDDGARWYSLQLNLPATPVTDLKVHRGDLAVSTQGRSFWILDDLAPLRQIAAQSARVATWELFPPRNAARGSIGVALQEVDLELPDDLPFGALLHYVAPPGASAGRLTVRDAAGAVVRAWDADSAQSALLGTNRLDITPGFHRLVWDLRGAGPRGGGRGVKLPPGQYIVELSSGAWKDSTRLTIVANPMVPSITQADYDAQHQLASAVRDTLSSIVAARQRLQGLTTRVRELRQRATVRGTALDSLTVTFLAELVSAERALASSDAPGLLAQYQLLYNTLVGDGGYGSGSAEGRPSVARFDRQRELDMLWNTARAAAAELMRSRIAAINTEAKRMGVDMLSSP